MRNRESLHPEELEDRRLVAAVGLTTLGLSPTQQTVLVGDFTGDGRQDVATLSTDGVWRVSVSTGTSFDTTIWGKWDSNSAWAGLFVGDFNGDGKTDVAGFTTTGTWVVGLSTGSGFATWDWAQWSAGSNWAGLYVGDFTGDGKTDVAGFTTLGTWVVGQSTSSSFATWNWAQWSPASSWTNLFVGDFNGDGKADVAGFTPGGTWVVGQSTGSGFATWNWAQWSPASSWTGLFVGDFNGDGKTDLAGFSLGATWVVGQSTGSAFGTWDWAQWDPSAGWTGLYVGDFTGTGKAGVAAINSFGTWVVGQSTGSAFGTSIWGQWDAAATWAGLVVGDFSGDHMAAVAGLSTDNSLAVGVSGGSGFGTTFWGQLPLDPSQLATAADVPAGSLGGGDLVSPFIAAQSPGSLQPMDFNNSASYLVFVDYFYGYARAWTAEANGLGITNDTQLQAFFSHKLDEHFQATRGVLAAEYPGLRDNQYRLLMAMNLADGYYVYGSQAAPVNDLGTLLNLPTACCTQIAELTASFARLQGIDAQVISLDADYATPQGTFGGGHMIVQAGGLWLDAQTNIAFAMDPVALQGWDPQQRLPMLLGAGNVYGFYNWYLNPSVRAEELTRGLDGGAMAFYWQYYLGSLGQGNTLYYAWGAWLPPVRAS
jgi:hypothetical protein